MDHTNADSATEDPMSETTGNGFDFSACMLGEDRPIVELQTSRDHRDALLSMLNQASRSLDIVSRDLDRAILHQRSIDRSLRSFVLRGTRPQVRCLIHDAERAVQEGHLLVEFARRFTSFAEIRVLGEPHKTFNDAFTVVDQVGVIFRNHAARYEGIANFADRKRGRDLTILFDEMWQASQPAANLRSFVL